MRRLLALLSIVAVAAALALAGGGCSPLKHIVQSTEPPHTVIFVSGPLDTVTHTVHMHWFGTSAHGYIAGYEVRMLNPLAPADTLWRFTTATDEVLTVYTPTGYAAPVFEARAIDDQGVRDPSPARQLFRFSNLPPVVRLVSKPNALDHSDTTFASVTVTWSITDPDGSAERVLCRLWLDGQPDSALYTIGTSFTMPSRRFKAGGAYVSGTRTLYIQGIDDGGMAGPIDSVSWYVKRPVAGTRARLLIVDDVPSTHASKLRVDTLYAHAVSNTGIAPDSYQYLHLQFNQPFRSAKDLEQTFAQYESVVWYRGEQPEFSRVLDSYAVGPNGEGLGAYIDGGGKVFIESLNLVSSWSSYGPISQAFVRKYLNSEGTFQYGIAPDSSGAWGMTATGTVLCPGVADSMLNRRNLTGLRAFVALDASQILMVVPAHVMSPDNPLDFPVAMNVPRGNGNGGRFIAVTYPLVSGTIPTPTFPQRASVVLLKTLGLLGLAP